MGFGLISGILWGLDTVLLGIALSMTPFVSSDQAIFLAPFVSTFLHDFFSSIWMLIYMAFRKEIKKTIKAATTKSGRFIMLGALLGGPIGMTGYLLAIKYLGPGYTAIISSLYPAIGALLSYVFLKEKMRKISILGLLLSISGIIVLGYSPSTGIGSNVSIGFVFGLVCVFGWASEAVICAYGMKEEEVTPEESLQIRQLTSAITYGFIIIPMLKAINFTANVALTASSSIILITALAGTTSYVFYYKAIHKIGATKAMSLNITYSAWSLVFGLILLSTEVNIKSILCCIAIMIGSVLAAGDFKDLKFIKNKRVDNVLNNE